MMTSLIILMMKMSLEGLLIMISISALFLSISYNMISQMEFMNVMFMNKNIWFLDTLSLSMMMLSLFLVPSAISSESMMTDSTFLLIMNFLLILLLMLFNTSTLIMFYILFESTILPVSILIMLYGYQPERLMASIYIMMYTMVASLPLFMSILLINTSYKYFIIMNKSNIYMVVMSVSMITAFLVKTPMYSLHSWLPKAHVEAPISGSMMLAGILLKMGIYAIMRLMQMKFLFMNINYFIPTVAIWGGCIAGFLCVRQTDMKCLIANSSVAHMSLTLMGTLINLTHGWLGSILLLISHGLCSSLMFYLGGMYYKYSKTRSLNLMMGQQLTTPLLMLWWCLAIICNSSIPPSLNMISELMIIISLFSFSSYWSFQIVLLSMISLLYSAILFITNNHGEKSHNKFSLKFKVSSINSMSYTIYLFLLSPTHILLCSYLL